MTRFQLVFRDHDGDRVETHDNPDATEPHLLGVLLLDGAIFARRETIWLATRDDLVDVHGKMSMARFICTPVPLVVGERQMTDRLDREFALGGISRDEWRDRHDSLVAWIEARNGSDDSDDADRSPSGVKQD